MGLRGSPRLSAEVLAARGSLEGRGRGAAIVCPMSETACPRDLRGEGRREWLRVVPDLLFRGVLGAGDHAMLRAYCEAVGEYRRLERVLRCDGLTVPNRFGVPVARAEVELRDAALARARVLALQFGLTPASRTNAAVAAKPRTEGKASLFIMPKAAGGG